MIDRFGSNSNGRYFSPIGSSFESRSLPPFMKKQPYSKYLVLKAILNETGKIEPWFDEVGMGTQYFTELMVRQLREQGYLLKIR